MAFITYTEYEIKMFHCRNRDILIPIFYLQFYAHESQVDAIIDWFYFFHAKPLIR